MLPAGVRLNTEMATGKRQGGKAKKKKRKHPPASELVTWAVLSDVGGGVVMLAS